MTNVSVGDDCAYTTQASDEVEPLYGFIEMNVLQVK